MKQRFFLVLVAVMCVTISGCGDDTPQATGSGVLNCTDASTQEQRDACMEKKKETWESDLGANPTPKSW